MRVLHVHDRASFQGGVEQILFDTARGLSAQGWPQALLTSDDHVDGKFAAVFDRVTNRLSEALEFGVDVAMMHKVADPARASAVAAVLPTAHMVHDHDLVCPRKHKYFPIGGRICTKAAGASCYANLCFVQRATPGSRIPIQLKGTAQVRKGLEAASGVRTFLVGSQYMRRELQMNGLPGNHISVLHPVPAALTEPRARPLGEERDFLFVGQVIRGKGVDLMLQALARLSGDWRATIVGAGNHLETCRELARTLGIAQQVTFTGWVPNDELEPYYSRARAVVVPSRWPEPFGMVGIEAMARGRPVIAFGSGGISDWLRDDMTGMLVPTGDIAAMSSAMQQLLDQPETARTMGAAAARHVQEHFSHQKYLAGVRTQLEQLL